MHHLTPSGRLSLPSLPSASRRSVLRGMGAAAALGAGIPLLSACGGSGTATDSKTVTLGSNASDAVRRTPSPRSTRRSRSSPGSRST